MNTNNEPKQYEYFVNLNERGSFYADVRTPDGETVFEVRAGAELSEDESSIFDDGFMRDAGDMSGLTYYLRDLGVIGRADCVIVAEG